MAGHAADESSLRHADEQGDGLAASCLGLLLEARGDAAGARAAYERADQRGDGMGAARLALMLSSQGDWEGAQALWRRADERGIDERGLALERELFGSRHEEFRPGRSATRSAFASPVLIGAATVLILLVAVFLAYNSNTGLPFVPTRQLKVDIADGANIVVGNDVREGGYRIGAVSGERPVLLSSGQPAAQLTLALSQSHGRVPVDSRVTVVSKSLLGLKFVDLSVGHSRRVFPDGATLPISHTAVPVQVDQVFDMFDARTRNAVRADLAGFGDALAARGASLNDTISSLPPLLGYLRPVAAYLSAPGTQLTGFLNSLDTFVRVLAPVSAPFGRLFGDMATTFAAVSASPADLEATIARSPSTLAVGTRSLQVQQPFLADLATLGGSLAPATASLRSALPAVNPAIEAGTRTLARTPPLNARLQGTLGALRELVMAPGTNVALNGLDATAGLLNPMVRYLGPYVTVCNDWNYMWTYLADVVSERTTFGFAQRALLMANNPLQPNNPSSEPAYAPANGGSPTDDLLFGNAYFHNQNYGAAVDPQGAADCEGGQRGYPLMLNHFDPQHRLFAADQHTPGDQGPTFTGRARVPAGETFSRNPSTGPQTPSVPGNN